MIVPFPFTFTFSVPGLTNPFSSTYSQPAPQVSCESEPPSEPASQVIIQNGKEPSVMGLGSRLATSPAPSFSSSASRPKNLKRGWEPAFAETSQSSTTLVATSGYLDPPPKQREFMSAPDMHDDDLSPPHKRRRGLAGSIVSTAVNAALIGTAVGLTVYRLWRGRGKETLTIQAADPASPDSENGSSHQLPPPPPYQEREWTPISYPIESASPPLPVTPNTTPRRRVVQRNAKRTRRSRVSRPQTAPSPGRVGPSSHIYTEPNLGRDGENGGDDQMDWIQDRLAQLIEEGKRALSREVVVMSDAKEDEVDDGSGVWEEEDDGYDRQPHQSASSIGRAGSLRHGTKRSRAQAQAQFYGAGNGSSHSLSSTSFHAPMTPRRTHTKAFSADAVARGISREDDTAWESPELRETMRLARERIAAGKGVS